MNRRILGFVFLLLALVFLSLPYLSLTGAAISETPSGQNIIYAITMIFFLASVFLFLSKQTLDAILIPTGDPIQKKRAKRALQEYDEKGAKYFITSGEIYGKFKR